VTRAIKMILIGAFLSGSGLLAAELYWEKDLKSAFEKSSANNRPLMVLVESKTCRWCKKMKHRTLENDTVSARLQSYVLVKVDRDEVSSTFIPYAKYVPTIYFMTPQKKILERVTGYFDIPDFNSWIDDVQIKLGKQK